MRSSWRWIKFACKYGLRVAIFYWREDRKPENAPKVRVDSNPATKSEPGVHENVGGRDSGSGRSTDGRAPGSEVSSPATSSDGAREGSTSTRHAAPSEASSPASSPESA